MSLSVSSRKLSLGVLVFSIVAHVAVFAFVWIDREDLALQFEFEFFAALCASLVLESAAYVTRKVYRFRLFHGLRALVLLVACLLLEGKSLLVFALLTGPLLVESALFDSDRGSWVLNGAAILLWSIAALRTYPGETAMVTVGHVSIFVLAESAIAVFSSLLVRYREGIVEHQERIRSLNATVVNLSEANRAFQTYADNMESETSERERSRITRELHDTVGYALTNVIVMMNAGKVLLRENVEALEDVFEKVRAQSEDALNETRQILYKLRAVHRFQPKGVQAVSHLIRSFQGATGVEIEFNPGNMPYTLGEGLDLVTFRIIQEGLTNAFRHGKATRVRINLWRARNEIRIAIWDNGTGTVHGSALSEGIGLAGMRERLNELGGTISATGVPGRFTLEATFPFHPEEIVEQD